MAARVARRRPLADRYVDAVQRRRDEVCFVIWLAGFALAWARHGAVQAGGIRSDVPVLAFFAVWSGSTAPLWAGWMLLLAGVGLRFWAAGNLEKNKFTRPTGPYVLTRHPLYTGTLSISLAFFVTLGAPVVGALLWVALVGGVFLPVARKEERELAARFGAAYGGYASRVPRFLPDPLAIGRALASDRFTTARAWKNYGFRALWFLPLVPALNYLLFAVTFRLH